jgi:hypothetical protein
LGRGRGDQAAGRGRPLVVQWLLYSGFIHRGPWTPLQIVETVTDAKGASKLVSFAVSGRFLSIRESTDRVDSLPEGLDGALASLRDRGRAVPAT